MYSVSAAFLAALRSADQRVIFDADVLSQGVVVASNLRVLGGSVEVDATATTRRRMTATVVDDTGALVPNDAADVLSPYGYELRVYRGYNLAIGGADELVPLGTFRIASAKVADNGAQTIELSGFDRSRSVQRARFESPYAVAAGTNYVTAIQSLISDRLPGTTFSSITTSLTTPALLFDQASDPWKAASDMAASIGAEVFFDPLGVCVIRNQPNTATDPVAFEYAEGVNSTLFTVENALDDDPGYNGVIVDGEPAGGTPSHAVVYDTNPLSPTYSLGRYGKVPTFMKSPYVTTQAQADQAAAAALLRAKGGTEQLRFSAIPNPAHEGGDVVRVVRTEIGVDDYYLLTQFGIPLDVTGVMSPTTRKRRTL